MKKFLAIIAIALLLFPVVFASHNNPPPEENCGIFSLGSCLTGFLSGFLNAAVKPLISLINKLLIDSGSPSIFKSLWGFVVFICSFIAFIFLTICGMKFIVNSDNPVERYNAKKGLKTIITIFVLLPLSFYFYTLILDLNASLSNAFLNDVTTKFLEVKITGLLSSILNLLLYLIYLLVLIITIVILILRYLIISVGVVILPLGLVLYCLDFTKPYGSLIINFLACNIFSGFIGAITLKIVSMISGAPVFNGFQVVFGIAAFLITDVLILICMLLVVLKSAFFGNGSLKVI